MFNVDQTSLALLGALQSSQLSPLVIGSALISLLLIRRVRRK
ncbi:hypothetical protein BH11ARM1_BH11ARM1_09280 [soil metagenome]